MELSIRLPQRAGAHVSNCPCPPYFFKREDINSMKKSYARIIALLLSLLLCVGILPAVVFAEEATAPKWPQLKELTIAANTKLSATGKGAEDRSLDRLVTNVTFENYEEPREVTSTNILVKRHLVGKITLHVEEAPSAVWQYELPAGTLSYTPVDGLPNDVADTGGLTGALGFPVGSLTGTKISFYEETKNATPKNPKNVYYYETEIVVEEPAPKWPQLKELTIAANTKLSATGKGAEDRSLDRLVTNVTFENYEEPREVTSTNILVKRHLVGKITLHVEEAPSAVWQYELPAGTLSYTPVDGLPNDVADTGGLTGALGFPVGSLTGTKISFYEETKNATPKNPKNVYYYETEIVVDSAEKTWDYPVIEQVILNDYDKLFTTGGQAITIVGLQLENFDTAVLNSTTDKGIEEWIAGEITVYIAQEPNPQKYYSLNDEFGHNAISTEVTSVEGFVIHKKIVSAMFEAGQREAISLSYAANSDNTKTYHYKIKIEVGYPDDGVYVFDGAGTRISPTRARVSFNANQAGTYHYAVADAAATDVPAMPNTGAEMKAGENTFVIDGLGEGAKKVYIWGKNGEKVSARPVEVNIGAEAKSYSLTFDTTTATTDGILRITADETDVSFKTRIMVTPTTTAKGIYEGQRVTVWMGNPHTDKDLNGVTLNPAVDVTIAPDKNSFSFTMPAADVYGTSNDWRTYVDSTETRYTLTGIASTFDQTNVSGIKMGHVVFKDEGGNIITQATSGTKVTATPVPSATANYRLEFQFTEWSDATGFTLADADKAKESLTFTVGSENISLKANFKPIGTKVTWGTNITSADTNAPQVSIPGSVSSPFVFKPQSTDASISGTAWYDRYKFEGWVITRDGKTLTGDAVNTSQAVGTPGTPGYWTYAKFDISGNEMTVTANFRERAFAAVTATVNDSAMGSATVAVGTGTPGTNIPAVFEGQTVTLTAAPGDRYTLKGWEVKDANNNDVTYTVAEDVVNVATFIMPDTRKDITAKAIFEVDPDKASTACDLSNVTLNIPGATSERSGTKYTIKVPADTDEAALAKAVLKCTVSEYADVVTADGSVWPEDGKACGMTLDTPVTFTVRSEKCRHGGDDTAKADYTVTITKAKSSEKDITAVKLLNADKSVIAEGKLNGTTWTITLPSDTDKALINKIGTSTDVFMQINYTGVSLAQAKGYDDATGIIGKWSSGNVMCGVSPNSSNTFTVTAEDGSTKTYTVAIEYTAPNAPTLSGGSATRSSKTAATVKFTSSEAGNYFYKMVDHGAAVPTVDTSKSGTSAVQGENTITLSNLTEDARDIYIVVVNASGGESTALKVEIPAYGSGSETPDTGKFTITINAPKGGTITTNRTKADKGDEIIVTVTPDSGYQMAEGSLTYSLAVAGGETVKITGNRFTMPAGNVTITCKWETATTTAKGITSFSINGVAGAVNNSTNTITITMPRGTDVTKLTPVIATNGVKSLTPGNGETVDFTNAVTYTAAMEDGSSKTYTVTVYVDKGTLADQFWDKLTDFATQVPWWQYAEKQQSTSKYPKYW